MLVVSPTAAYSIRRSEPTLPDMTGPLHTPMPMENGSPTLRSATQALSCGRRSRSISCTAAMARSAWSSCSSGAPKTAMIPSPW